MRIVTMKELLESGVHFGHRTRRWHPRMAPYIFTERNGIHIIDLEKTLRGLEKAYALVRDIVSEGGSVLFVGTKRQAQDTIQLEAERCGMPWITHRWLGGTMTNWDTIRQRVNELNHLERQRDQGEFDLLPKKEALNKTRKIDRLDMPLSEEIYDRLSGISLIHDLSHGRIFIALPNTQIGFRPGFQRKDRITFGFAHIHPFHQ
jgi:small subunit ribosomal protein S2